MKTTLTTLLWFLLNPNLPKELAFDVHRTYDRPVKMEKLQTAHTISDFWEGFPKAWIIDCISSEISATCNGRILKAKGLNDTLNAEQQRILQTADMGSAIDIKIDYRYPNPVTNGIHVHQMNLSVAVVPDMEATYPEGHEKLKSYLAENGISKLQLKDVALFKGTTVRFTINEEGAVTNDYVFESSGDAATDKILLDAVHKMPRWNPAKMNTGSKVKQEFVFAVGVGGC